MDAIGRSGAMIGRKAELEMLLALQAEAAAGVPHVVAIGGEAGIGKSRLVEEFTGRLADDVAVASGQCVDLGFAGVPYAPLTAVVRDLIERFGDEAVLAAAGNGREALTALVDGVGPSPAGDRLGAARLHEVVATLLEEITPGPLVVVVEDVHWADPATLDVLRFVARIVRRGRLLLVLTYRSDDVGRGHPLRSFLAELERGRHSRRMILERLTRDQVRRQAVTLMGSEPGADLTSALFERSEGVPFFVEELVRLGIADARPIVPESLRDLLLARYDVLDDDARQVVRMLAAGGGRVEHSLLAEVAGENAALETSLRAAVDAGIIVVDGDGYVFRHALVGDAVNAQLLPGESSRFHVAFAEALENRPQGTVDAAHAVLASYHWHEARVLDRAFTASIAAMRLSRAAFAVASAARMGERAIELWDRVDDPERLAGTDKVRLIAGTSRAWRDAGDIPRALATIALAFEELDPSEHLLRARLLSDKARLVVFDGQEGAADLLAEALGYVRPGEDRALRANILAELAAQLMLTNSINEAITRATEALDEATTPESRRFASVAANVRGCSLVNAGKVAEGLADLTRASELAGDDAAALLRYYVNASDTHQLLGSYRESLRIASEGLTRARAAGVERSTGSILAVNTVDPLFCLGEWDRADELIDASLDRDPPPAFRVYLRRAKIRSILWRGDPEGAHERYLSWAGSMDRLARAEAQTRAGIALDMAEVALARDDLAEAWERSAIVIRERLDSPGWSLPLIGVAARTLARLRRARSAAAGILPELDLDLQEERLRAELAGSAGWPTHPLFAAIVDAELSGPDRDGGDPAAWRNAIDAATEAPAHLALLVRLGLAHALARNGDRAQASLVLGDLRSRAADLGAGLIVRWADDLAARTGGGTDRARDEHELTPRERQVLELVAEGLSNAQIAARLFISPKTVSVHVSAVLRKVGAASRTEAARHVSPPA